MEKKDRKEYYKKWRQEKGQELKNKRKEKIPCSICWKDISIPNLARHEKKHLKK